MASTIVDLDGTILQWGTNDFLPGAYEALRAFVDRGNELVFITQRPRAGNEEVVGMLGGYFPDAPILFGFTSPRILINDQGAVAENHPANGAWEPNNVLSKF